MQPLSTLKPGASPEPALRSPAALLPPRPRSVEETGLSMAYIADLVIRALYIVGEMTGQDIVELLHLPYENILEQAIAYLRREQMVEVKGTGGLGEKGFRYQATAKGIGRAREIGERSQYLGPAPVPLGVYMNVMQRQTTRGLVVSDETITQAFAHLVVGDSLLAQLGPAINSGRSIFLFGHAGNGKTFDPVHHNTIPIPPEQEALTDRRWVVTKRPVVVTGGELNMAALDLVYDEQSKYYEAPLQMKANGGLFLIDDFGRQQIEPHALLNRWIVPLEKRVDFLTLHTGKKIEVPFDQLIIFSTNLEPKYLVDEAFLRRIRYKIQVPNPTWQEYREILKRICEDRNVAYSDEGLRYLIESEYPRRKIEPRSVHPRDLIDQLIDIARFMKVPPTMSRELLAASCRSYFVEL
jgi:predicted ATPase with chaperone activity